MQGGEDSFWHEASPSYCMLNWKCTQFRQNDVLWRYSKVTLSSLLCCRCTSMHYTRFDFVSFSIQMVVCICMSANCQNVQLLECFSDAWSCGLCKKFGSSVQKQSGKFCKFVLNLLSLMPVRWNIALRFLVRSKRAMSALHNGLPNQMTPRRRGSSSNKRYVLF